MYRMIFRLVKILSLVWWTLASIATGLMLMLAPLANTAPFPTGCFLTSDLIFHVSCNGTWNDEIISRLLSWALYWTAESPVMIEMAIRGPAWIYGLGFVLVWLASLYLALRLLVRLLFRTIWAVRT